MSRLEKKHYNILKWLSDLPQKLILLHESDVAHIPGFVLHHLCHENGFALKRAAFFIDNPDFDVMQGVVGFSDQEQYKKSDLWDNPHDFLQHMHDAPFNQKVRSFHRCSMQRNNESSQKVVDTIKQDFTLADPSHHMLKLKHGNVGLFVYEQTPNFSDIQEHLKPSLALFGLCPLF